MSTGSTSAFRKARRKDPATIRSMFDSITPRYDMLNTVLSLDRDRRWRRRAVQSVGAGPGHAVLDFCTGTGEQAFEFSRAD